VSRGGIDALARALLYEGYALYPYRPSALKNQRRWTFGGLHPRAWSDAEGGVDRWWLRAECLLEGGPASAVDVTIRFLHLSASNEAGAPGDAWQAGREREVVLSGLPLARILDRPRVLRFAFPTAGEALSPGARQAAVEGTVELSAATADGCAVRLAVRVQNVTPFDPALGRDEADLRLLASTHAVIEARDGRFVSLIDPPGHLREAASACANVGVWPVLVGAPGERGVVLAAPIVLEDYPRVAPESPGDLFDATEIDEVLTLRILTLTDDEKRAMRAADDRTRALLERTERLAPETRERLHGALRRLEPAAATGAARLAPGRRVRLRPRGRADILDLALAGRSATVAAVEEDQEGRIFLAVTVDDDPGRDLGAQGEPGHRFFFRPDEVEPLE
jgi:hypothetical protein